MLEVVKHVIGWNMNPIRLLLSLLRRAKESSQCPMKTVSDPSPSAPDKAITKIIPISFADPGECFKELNPDYQYTIVKYKTRHAATVTARDDGKWMVFKSEIDFRIVSRETATRLVNKALDDNYIIAYLHLSTGQTGAVGREGAVQP